MSTLISSQGFEYGVKHFHAPIQGLVTDIVQNTLNLSNEKIEELFYLGSVYVQGQRWTDKNLVITEGALVRVHTKPRRYSCDYNWLSRLVFQNDYFLVLNKPAGLPSHPSVDNQIENSLTQTEKALGKKIFITHRLDSLTEGLIVYSFTPEFTKQFNHRLQNHLITKKYIALCETSDKKIPLHIPHKLYHSMQPSPRAPKTVSPYKVEGWEDCELIIEEQKTIDTAQWFKIHLLTGRTHQIRAQLSHSGYPILGDFQYGARLSWPSSSDTNTDTPTQKIALRAQSLEFEFQGQIYSFQLSENFELVAQS